jgi:EAL domain-containing protein (putative c-di-GMP-specific phosphodiesterase class I)/ActR/RegA family two-component response regulator
MIMTGTNSNPYLLPAALHSLRTLIIDDDEFMLEVVEETLRSFGLSDMTRATSGKAALRVIDSSQQPIQLIVCDLNMENIDGIEFLRHLADRQCKAAILVLSASDARILHSVNALASEHDLRFLGSLRKPLEVSELYATLLKHGRRIPGGDERGVASTEKLLNAEQLEEGMRAGRAQVAFQPIFSVKKRRVVGAECLLRWRDPERGTLSPEPVVFSAEEHGLIIPLTEIVLQQALEALTDWSRSVEGLSVSVNLSSRSLNDLELPEILAGQVRAAGIETHRVVLELTETGVFADPASSLEVINRLALKGFRLAIDDFGIGQSNLQKLNNMPFAQLKVDKSFVQGAREHAVARAIVESSVSLAHTLDMQVVAEGTEIQQDLEFVIRAGCDKIQGHAIAKPMPAASFIPWLEIWDAGSAAGSSSYLHR